jgi:hypothetical protein
MAEAVAILPYVEKVCKNTVEAVFEDYFEAVRGFRAFFTLVGATRSR